MLVRYAKAIVKTVGMRKVAGIAAPAHNCTASVAGNDGLLIRGNIKIAEIT
jgi:hypothetical protein